MCRKTYQLTFCDANGRRKDRPNGGLYITENADEARTMTAGGVNGLLVVDIHENENDICGPPEHTERNTPYRR